MNFTTLVPPILIKMGEGFVNGCMFTLGAMGAKYLLGRLEPKVDKTTKKPVEVPPVVLDTGDEL